MATTLEGKAIASRNAFKHGAKSAETCAIRNWLKGLRSLVREVQQPTNSTGRMHQIDGGNSNKE